MKKELMYFIIFISHNFWCASQDIQISTVPITHSFSPEQYKGGVENWDLSQDQNGLIYVANNHGLLEFDGKDWNMLPKVPFSLKLRTVAIHNKNKIFVGGARQFGYYELKENGFVFYSLVGLVPEAMSFDEVWKVITLKNSILLDTDNFLLKFDGSRIKEIPVDGKLSFIYQAGEQVFLQTHSQGIVAVEEDGIKVLEGASAFEGKLVGVLPHGHGFLFISEEGKIYDSSKKFIQVGDYLHSYLQRAIVSTCLKLKDGSIVIGTKNDGLFILDDKLTLQHHLTRGRGLHQRSVLSLLEDQSNNLWVGLNNGISIIELSSPLSFINEQLGVKGTGRDAIIHKGQCYLATTNGLFMMPLAQKHQISAIEKKYEIIKGSEGNANSLSLVDGDLLLSHNKGAYTVENNKVVNFFDKTGAWKFNSIKATKNTMIGGTYDGLYLFNKKNKWNLISKINNFKESSRVFEFENDSTIWVAHGYKGVYKILLKSNFSDTKKIQYFGSNQGFPSDILINVYRLENNLVFPASEGIFSFDAPLQKFVPHHFLNNWMGSGHISEIEDTKKDIIYFILDNELGALKKRSIGQYSTEMSAFSAINKHLSGELNNVIVLDEKNVLICAKEGFIHYDPTKSLNNSKLEDKKILIREILIKSDSLLQLKKSFEQLLFKHPSSIQFNFSIPYFNGIEDIQYAVRLSPYEKDWSEWSSTTFKEYTNLTSGDYNFEVKAHNLFSSEESQITSVSFFISPIWYKSKVSYFAYFILFFLSIILLYFKQERRYKKVKTKLRVSKEEAIKHKEEEFYIASEKSSKRIKEMKNEGLKKEITFKNNELTMITMHFLSKNQLLQKVRKKIEVANKDSRSLEQEVPKILKMIDKNLKDDENWEKFEYHFDQVHGNFLKKMRSKVNLTSKEMKLCAFLRMKMSSKDIASILMISARGVELARYRLRKKLNLNRDTNLYDYLNDFSN